MCWLYLRLQMPLLELAKQRIQYSVHGQLGSRSDCMTSSLHGLSKVANKAKELANKLFCMNINAKTFELLQPLLLGNEILAYSQNISLCKSMRYRIVVRVKLILFRFWKFKYSCMFDKLYHKQ